MNNDIESIKKQIEELSAKNLNGENVSVEKINAVITQVTTLQSIKPNSDIDKALNILINFFNKKNENALLENFKKPHLAKYLGIFTGITNLKNSIIHHPEKATYIEALALLDPIAQYALVDDTIRKFLLYFYDSRKREIWIPAARAMVLFSLRDKNTEAFIVQQWLIHFPEGLNKDLVKIISGDAHKKRHLLYAVSYYISLTKNTALFPEFELGQFIKLGFLHNETDGSWTSIQLLCFIELWDYAFSADIIENTILFHIDKLEKNSLVDASLRDLYVKVVKDEKIRPALAEIIKTKLLKKDFLTIGKKLDYLTETLWCWLSNVAFLKNRNELIPLDVLPDPEDPLVFLIQLKMGLGNSFSLNQIRERFICNLKIVFNEDEWLTQEPIKQAQYLVELILIAKETEIGKYKLQHFLKIATNDKNNTFSNYSLAVIDGIYLFLADCIAKYNVIPRIFFYEVNYSQNALCKLSAIPNGLISIQVAIQIENTIREKKSACEIIKFLWQLLKHDPQTKVFEELLILFQKDVLLHEVISCFNELDKLRDKKENDTFDLGKYIDTYKLLTHLLLEFIDKDIENTNEHEANESQNIKELLLSIDNIMIELKKYINTDKVENIIPELEQLIGNDNNSKFLEWFKSLNMGTLNVNKHWILFVQKFQNIQYESYIDAKTHEDFVECLHTLKYSLEEITWLEFTIIEKFFDKFITWADKSKANYTNSAKVNNYIISLINTNKFDEIQLEVNHFLIDNQEKQDDSTPSEQIAIRLLSTSTILILHDYLLNNFLFGLSEKVRKNIYVIKKVKLPTFWKYLAPLLFGVIAGPFFILDFGTEWNVVLSKGKEVSMISVILISLIISALLLGSKFLNKMNRIRFAVVFFSLFAFSFFISSLILMSFSGSSIRMSGGVEINFFLQAFLWASLSLFFGFFFGMILQGKESMGN